MGSVIDINGTAEITAPACVMETAAVIEGHPVIDMGHVGILTVRQLLAFQVYIRGFIQDLIDARGRRPGARKHSGHAVCIQYAGPVPVDPDMLSGDIDFNIGIAQPVIFGPEFSGEILRFPGHRLTVLQLLGQQFPFRGLVHGIAVVTAADADGSDSGRGEGPGVRNCIDVYGNLVHIVPYMIRPDFLIFIIMAVLIHRQPGLQRFGVQPHLLVPFGHDISDIGSNVAVELIGLLIQFLIVSAD